MPTRPDELVDLTTAPNEAAAAVIKSVLDDNGIDAILVSAPLTMTAYFGNAVVPTCVRVRQEDLDRAQQVLETNKDESVDLDWEDVDVGDPEDPLAAAIAARTSTTPFLRDVTSYRPVAILFVLMIGLGLVGALALQFGAHHLATGVGNAIIMLCGITMVYVVWARMRWKRSRRASADESKR